MGQLSPRQVAFVAALVIAFAVGAIIAAWGFLHPSGPGLLAGFLVPLMVLAVAYPVFSFGIERFINSRIKVLYRTVHELKRSPKEKEPAALKGDLIGQVDSEVADWAKERWMEISELREREEFRREFIGNLAHELKTPIFNIQGYILTLLEGGLEDKNVNRDFLQRASNGVDRLIKIVEDLDLITKLESGVMDLRVARMDLSALVTEVIQSSELVANEKRITLVNELPPELMVMADSNRMDQVFTNLFNNAINYGKPGGRCAVRSFPLDEQVLIEVSDDGIGISKEHLPRLFERFYRVGKSRSRNEGGSGLGLAIVKHIIDVHGGTITVKSKEEEGTTFSFTIKRAP